MKERFDVTGMTCASCQANVEKAVKKLGVDDVSVNLVSETMNVYFYGTHDFSSPSKIFNGK